MSRNMPGRFLSNSEAFASELLKNIQDMFDVRGMKTELLPY